MEILGKIAQGRGKTIPALMNPDLEKTDYKSLKKRAVSSSV